MHELAQKENLKCFCFFKMNTKRHCGWCAKIGLLKKKLSHEDCFNAGTYLYAILRRLSQVLRNILKYSKANIQTRFQSRLSFTIFNNNLVWWRHLWITSFFLLRQFSFPIAFKITSFLLSIICRKMMLLNYFSYLSCNWWYFVIFS